MDWSPIPGKHPNKKKRYKKREEEKEKGNVVFLIIYSQQVFTRYADGVNVDIEDALDAKDAPALTALVSKLSQ